MWADQVHALDPHYRVVSYDHRGHGLSPASARPFLFESFVDDLLGLLDHLHLSKVVLCGLSMGGYVALRATERAPEKIHGLILSDTRSEGDTDAARLNRAKDLAVIQREGLTAFAAQLTRRSLAPATVENNLSLVSQVEKMIIGNPVAGVEAALVALATRTDTTASLAKIHVPTLVIVGEHDALTPPAAAQSLQQKTPGAQLITVPKSGHLSNMENPDAFNGALLAFLNSLPKS